MSLSREGVPILTETVLSSGAMVKGRFVGADGAYASAAGNAIGISSVDAISVGKPISVVTLGLYYVIAGAAFAAGVKIEVGVDGKAVELSAGIAVARAREAGVSDRETLVFLIPN